MQFLSGTLATALVATFTLTATVPLDAAPIFVPRAQSAQSDVIQIRDGFRGGGNYGWHRGYGGHRYYGSGYHRHDDFWLPGGAFVAGALIGSIIANSGYYGGYYGSRYYGGGYYPEPYYDNRYYYGDGYYRQPYYGTRYYGRHYRNRYYGNRYYGNRYYRSQYYGNYRPCTSRAADAGLCF
ncbi:BA14K family protein [Pseudaminobacter arsenicus]|uniref:BA14K family protein n=1 Tax=Borborobacter arsenicus TaxID=1851146 RepID=A0A432V4G3_9HYPH|nr:BA14K family protein [Pseudaminobacter arsenicus]RUM97000.1 BA14K family protein [Pseudaminobacter arsenicus]